MARKTSAINKSLLFLLSIIPLFTLSSCKSKPNPIQQALQGRWVYGWNASAIGVDCYTMYEFTENGVTHLFIRDDGNGIVEEDHGTYKITEDAIILTFEGKSQVQMDYTFENGSLKLTVHRGSVEENYVKMNNEQE